MKKLKPYDLKGMQFHNQREGESKTKSGRRLNFLLLRISLRGLHNNGWVIAYYKKAR